jgi:hypothetical protein
MLTASHYKIVLYNTLTEEYSAYRIIFFSAETLAVTSQKRNWSLCAWHQLMQQFSILLGLTDNCLKELFCPHNCLKELFCPQHSVKGWFILDIISAKLYMFLPKSPIPMG